MAVVLPEGHSPEYNGHRCNACYPLSAKHRLAVVTHLDDAAEGQAAGNPTALENAGTGIETFRQTDWAGIDKRVSVPVKDYERLKNEVAALEEGRNSWRAEACRRGETLVELRAAYERAKRQRDELFEAKYGKKPDEVLAANQPSKRVLSCQGDYPDDLEVIG